MGAGTGIGTTYTTYKERATAPSTPGATYDRLYFTSAGPYYVNSAGVASPVTSGFVAGYAADAGANDAYAITLSPAPAALEAGMLVLFKANTANTGNATLNVNGLGAKNILKNHDQTLSDGDIEAGQIVTVAYDGTQFQMQSQRGLTTGTGAEVHATSPTMTSPTINTGMTLGDACAVLWDIAPATTGTWSGDTESGTTGESVAIYGLVYMNSDGLWWKADADSISTMPVQAIATAAINTTTGVLLRRGVIKNTSWTWTVGGLLYCGTDGLLTQTAPSGEFDVIQVVGIALTADTVYFDPSPIMLEVGLDVENDDAGQTISMAELSVVPKAFVCTCGAGDKTFGFEAPAAADVGKEWIVIKEDAAGAGKIIIDAPAGVTMSRAADTSSAGGTYTSEASKFQMIHLKIITTTQVYVMATDGTWTGA
jgi:hypothetical protein